MTYISRAKEGIEKFKRFDASSPSNAQLDEMAQSALYHPTSGHIWDAILVENSLVVNPSNLDVRDDIGTLAGEVFTPSSSGTINALLGAQFIRYTRKFWRDSYRAFRLRFTNASAEPLADARATIVADSDVAAAAIIGTDDDDPEN